MEILSRRRKVIQRKARNDGEEKDNEKNKLSCSLDKISRQDSSECFGPKKLTPTKANSNEALTVADGHVDFTTTGSKMERKTSPKWKSVRCPKIPDGVRYDGARNHVPSASGDACKAILRVPENDSGVQTTFRINSGSDNHFLHSTMIPGVKQKVMQDVRCQNTEPSQGSSSIRAPSCFLGKSDILKLKTRDKGRRFMPQA